MSKPKIQFVESIVKKILNEQSETFTIQIPKQANVSVSNGEILITIDKSTFKQFVAALKQSGIKYDVDLF